MIKVFNRKILLFVIVCCINTAAFAQNAETDSLKNKLSIETNDNKRVTILKSLSYAYLSSYPDTAMKYALEGLRLAQENNYSKGEAICTNALGNVYFHIGDNAKALEMYLEYLRMKEALKDRDNISVAYYNIAGVYTEEKDYNHALSYLFKAKKEDEKNKDSSAILYDLYSLASNYLRMEKTDSALKYNNLAYTFSRRLNDKDMIGAVLNNMAEIYFFMDDVVLANAYYRFSIPYTEAVTDNEVLTSNYYGLAKVYDKKSMFDSAVFFARKALSIAEQAPFYKQVLEISNFLTGLFSAKKRFDSAFYYEQISIATKDSLFNIEEVRKVQNLKFQEQQRQQAIEAAKIKYRNSIKLWIAAIVCIAFLTIVIILWLNNKQKQKANSLLAAQKQKLESTLSELKSTQAQLVQQEKMASLGELTAGIAHEIQNPLNFVNNFSEVNNELITELQIEKAKAISERDKNLENEILNDLKQNLEKINHHGKRAGAIVKSMLQHSRKNTGQKEPTDINALCDEYLRLSYHGLRAKDKSFNADFKMELDGTIGKINIIPQDIGRVLINLFNNAFYAVNEKKKSNELSVTSYEPLVSVQTKKLNNNIEIRVSDNGSGIPQNIIDKIFQPFFTTKPTGQGTGLGLSLVYDIITKEHGGTIKVESKVDEGTIFIINLPV